MVSLKKYCGSRFITVDDVRDGPIKDRIAEVLPGKYDKLNVVFESGDKLSLNKTNAKVLRKLFGDDTENAIGQEIEMHLGKIEYQGADHDAVLISAPEEVDLPSPPIKPAKAKTTEQKKPPPDFDDEIPFR